MTNRSRDRTTLSFLEPIDLDAVDGADLYDELPLWSAPFGLMALDRVPIGREFAILDVGCGTGFLSIELAERCGAQARVFAVDPWSAAVERLRRKVVYRGLQNVSIFEQDAVSLDLPDASIDVIVSNLSVNNFDEPASVLETCARVAKPGATFVLTTNVIGHMDEFYEIYRAVLTDQERPELLDALERHIADRATVDGLIALLAAAGFATASVDTGSFRWRFADGAALLRHHFIRLGFLGGWRSILGTDDVSTTFASLETALNALASENGEIGLTIPMACVTAIRAR